MCGMHVCVMWDNKLVRGFLSSLTSDSTAARVQGARSTFSSSVNHFFTRLLLNGISHGESCSYTRSQALTNMLYRVCLRKYFDGYITKLVLYNSLGGSVIIHDHSKKTTFASSSFSILTLL